MEINVGDYIEGHKITRIEKDPFVKNQMYIETEDIEENQLGDRSIIAYHIMKGENK